MAECSLASLPPAAADTALNEEPRSTLKQMPSWAQAILEQQAATNHLLESFIAQHSPPLAPLGMVPQCHSLPHVQPNLGCPASPVFSATQRKPTIVPTLVKEGRSL
uniref:Uncharacterized protein n=1 Tax=Ustilago esculenta TaxID=185366 RepID=A0A481SI87_9BASI|nr:hypothetical protein UEMT_2032 [Ustilago esculenta]